MTAPRLTYRPALDGLRALAVVAVMLYHGQVEWLPGGFLGVDVFFVLSGYLITSLLVLEARDWATIDLLGFWLRRARRLLPALFLVLAAVAVYGSFAIASDRLARLRGDAVATLLYVANWRFATSGQSYFERFQEPSPLLHMWSLGIEEQFYWLFPLFLIVWFRVRGSSRGLMVLFAVAAASSAILMATLYVPGADPSRLYYGTDTRAQTLLVGAALAMFDLRPRKLRSDTVETRWAIGRLTIGVGALTSPAIARFSGLLGMIGLGLCFFVVHTSDGWLYRGGFLLVALCSAAVVRAAAAPDLTGPLRVLSWEPFRRIGLISYGLYLWHWPVFVALSPARTGLGETPLILVRFLATFALATFSYVLVENPIRRGGRRSWIRPRLRSAAVATSVAAVLGVIFVGTSGATSGQQPVASGSADTRLNDPQAGQVSVLLAGDSTGESLGWYFPTAGYPNAALSMTTRPGCGLPEQTVVVQGQVTSHETQCDSWPREFAGAATSVKPDVVVLATGTWEVFDHKVNGKILKVGSAAYAQELEKRYDQAINALAGSSRPVTILNVPCFAQHHWDINGADLAAVLNDADRQTWVNGVIAQVAAHHPGQVQVADLRGLLCPHGIFQHTISGIDVRPDGVHVTRSGAEIVWRWLMPQLEKQMAATPTASTFVVGDSVALGLREDFPFRSFGRLRVRGSTYLGCGLSPYAASYRGEAKPLLAQCPKWSDEWPADVRHDRPEVGVVMLGIQEQFDQVVGDRTLRFGTPAFEKHIDDVLDRSFAPFRAVGSQLAVMTVPCHGVADFGTSIDAKVINDETRVHRLNLMIARYAKSNPDVQLLDLHGLLCRDGFTESLNGVKLRKDGLHFSPAGARLVWQWLAPQIESLAAAQARPPTHSTR